MHTFNDTMEHEQMNPPPGGYDGTTPVPGNIGGGSPFGSESTFRKEGVDSFPVSDSNFTPNKIDSLHENVEISAQNFSKTHALDKRLNELQTSLSAEVLSKYIDRLNLRISIPALAEIQKEKSPDYDPVFGPMMFAFFDRDKIRTVTEKYFYKNGSTGEVDKFVANTIPHFTEFARRIRVTEGTLKRWAKKYPEFAHYMDMCKEIYEEFLIENGLSGQYNAATMSFVATNKTKMKNKTITENRTVDINEILNQIEKGVKPNDLTDGNIIDI